MSLPDSGIYTIINAQHNTVATISSPGGDVHGNHNAGGDSHRWTVRKVSTNNYTIQNMGFDATYASCNNIPTKGNNVFGAPSSRHWVLQLVGGHIAISSLDAPNIYWSLASNVLNTPVIFDDNPSAAKAQWIFKKE